jgi:hypothetical protein
MITDREQQIASRAPTGDVCDNLLHLFASMKENQNEEFRCGHWSPTVAFSAKEDEVMFRCRTRIADRRRIMP